MDQHPIQGQRKAFSVTADTRDFYLMALLDTGLKLIINKTVSSLFPQQGTQNHRTQICLIALILYRELHEKKSPDHKPKFKNCTVQQKCETLCCVLKREILVTLVRTLLQKVGSLTASTAFKLISKMLHSPTFCSSWSGKP